MDVLDFLADQENDRSDERPLGSPPEPVEPDEQVRLRIGQKLNLALDEFEQAIGSKLLVTKLQARITRIQSASPLAERFPL